MDKKLYKRCQVIKCNKLAVLRNIGLCKFHSCRCEDGGSVCKIHKKKNDFAEEMELKNGNIVREVIENKERVFVSAEKSYWDAIDNKKNG